MSETHYINYEGKRVATTKHHLNRGTCCGSGCLHCPYGTTLKRFGLTFHALEGEKLDIAKNLTGEKQGIAASLLQQAFGKKSVFPQIDDANAHNFLLFDLKGYYAGVAQLEGDKIIRVLHFPYFGEQGLALDSVNEYYQLWLKKKAS